MIHVIVPETFYRVYKNKSDFSSDNIYINRIYRFVFIQYELQSILFQLCIKLYSIRARELKRKFVLKRH